MWNGGNRVNGVDSSISRVGMQGRCRVGMQGVGDDGLWVLHRFIF